PLRHPTCHIARLSRVSCVYEPVRGENVTDGPAGGEVRATATATTRSLAARPPSCNSTDAPAARLCSHDHHYLGDRHRSEQRGLFADRHGPPSAARISVAGSTRGDPRTEIAGGSGTNSSCAGSPGGLGTAGDVVRRARRMSNR